MQWGGMLSRRPIPGLPQGQGSACDQAPEFLGRFFLGSRFAKLIPLDRVGWLMQPPGQTHLFAPRASLPLWLAYANRAEARAATGLKRPRCLG